jgi:hypothetical protein
MHMRQVLHFLHLWEVPLVAQTMVVFIFVDLVALRRLLVLMWESRLVLQLKFSAQLPSLLGLTRS